MTFEELHEAIEGEKPVNEKEAAKLLEDYYQKEQMTKQDILKNFSEIVMKSIIFLNSNYNEFMKSLCFLEYEDTSTIEYKTFDELSVFLKNSIKQLNRFNKKLEKLIKINERKYKNADHSEKSNKKRSTVS